MASTISAMQTRMARRVALLSAIYTLVLPAAYAWRFPLIGPVYFFVGDAFYYLDIARHAVAHQGFSFDGQFVTNGFHPLWEWLLTICGLLRLFPSSSPAATLSFDFWLDALLLSAAAGLFTLFATRQLKRPALALLVVAPGLLWFATGLINTQYLATWTYLNGMESALTMFFCASAFCLASPAMSLRRGLCCSLLLGLTVLSRLDDALIALPILIVLPVKGRRQRMLASLPAAGLLLAYLAYNKITVGPMLPLSGAAKASLALSYNFRWLLALFLAVVTGDLPNVLVPQAYYGFGERAARIAQMVLPALVCTVELVVFTQRDRQRKLSRHSVLIEGAAAGVCLKALYNFCFVLAWAQGQWYYAVSVAITNIILVLWVDRLVAHSLPSPSRVKEIVWLTAHTLLVLVSFNIFISRRNVEGPDSEVTLLRDPTPLKDKLRKLNADKLIEYDDGFTSFVAGEPALAGLGLALDAAAARALQEGRFLELAYQRGYRVVVTHGVYAGIIEEARKGRQHSSDPRFSFLLQKELAGYRLDAAGGDGSADNLQFYLLLPR